VSEVEPTDIIAAVFADLDLATVSASARDHAIDLLLDALVCGLAADHAEDTASFSAVVDGIAGPGASTVIGDASRRAIASAVLLNGFRITAVTACDVYQPAELHTAPAVVPPALAIAEREGATGRDLLRAVIVGVETAVRLANAFDRTEYKARGWHSPGVIAPFGGAAAVASLLRLDAIRTRDALAIAASQAAGTWVQRGTPTVKFHQARAAFAGLMGGLLAAEGFTGSARVMTGPEGGMFAAYAPGNPAAALDGLGERWQLEQVSIRLWPGSARLQPVIAAAAEVAHGSTSAWTDIEQVDVRVAPSIAKAQAWAAEPTSTFESLASIPYSVAATLRFGAAAPIRFTESGYTDRETRAFMAERIRVVGDEAIEAPSARVAVTTTDGARHESTVDIPPGDPRRPASRAELEHKAHLFGDDRIGAPQVNALIARVRDIEQAPDLNAILALARGDARA
jgi:2-methylcitrate dehydratase PrpD